MRSLSLANAALSNCTMFLHFKRPDGVLRRSQSYISSKSVQLDGPLASMLGPALMSDCHVPADSRSRFRLEQLTMTK